MRLQKYMASSGVASRRSCESIINESRVKVNGKIVNVMGYKVDPERDVVQVDDKVIKLNLNYEYYILNKPIGVVCTAKDEKNRPTVVDMIESKKDYILLDDWTLILPV